MDERAGATARRPTSSSSTPRRCVVGDGDASSGCARPRRRRHFRRRAGRGSRPDPAGDARRARTSSSPGRRPRRRFHGAMRRTAARRETAQRRAAGGDDAGVLRRQGRRRHDDGGGELRRRARAAEQAVDGHRRPEAGTRRGGAVPRRAPALQRARRDRQPAPARSRVPARAGGEAQVGAGDPRRLRSVRSAGRRRRRRRSKSCSGCWRGSTTTSSSTPAARSIRARWPRSTPPTRCSWSPTPTCRRCATRSGCSIACGSSAPAASACGVLLNRAAEPYPDSAEADRGRRSAIRFITRSRATTRPSRPRSTRACRWRSAGNSDIADAVRQLHAADSRAGRRGRPSAAATKRNLLGPRTTRSIW